MDLNQKPFICSWKNCKKEFTNEDHLNVHMKKHNFALFLNGDCQNLLVADQTPTPTRFIQNCEELGLFQDLQNVNPFEETFRKANECTENKLSAIPETLEDTLLTPHILPNLVDDFDPVNNMSDSDDPSLLIDEPKLSVDIAPQPIYLNTRIVCHKINLNTPKWNIVETNSKNDNNPDLQANSVTQYSSDSSDSSDDKLRIISDGYCNSADLKLKLQRQRENNRAAQIRSRAKKKNQFDRVVDEVNKLKSEKNNLLQENLQLKHTIEGLKGVLMYHQNCPVSKDPALVKEVNNLLKASIGEIKEPTELNIGKSLIPILPNNQKFVKLPQIYQVNLQKQAALSSPTCADSSATMVSNPETILTPDKNNTLSAGSNMYVVGQPYIIKQPAGATPASRINNICKRKSDTFTNITNKVPRQEDDQGSTGK